MPKYVPKERDVILAYLPGNSQAFLKRIQVYLTAKERLVNLDPTRLQQHQQRVDKALNENPDDVESLHELAILYELQGEFSKATDVLEDLLEKLLDIKQDCPDIYMQLGALYESQERDEGALDAYREACENWKKGGLKLRPVICLRKLPPHYQDFLVCGISSQIARRQPDFDEVVGREFDNVRLMAGQSVIRLGFLGRVGTTEIVGCIGSISPVRHRRLLKKLGTYLVK